MRRHGMILFIVAMLMLPIMAVTFSSCTKKAAKSEQTGMTDEEKAKLKAEADRKAREQAAADRERRIKEQDATAARQLKADRNAAKKREVALARERFESDHVQFDFDQYAITPAASIILSRKASYMRKNKNITVEIQGHCDERGTDDYNLALGDRRAIAAAKFLVSMGIARDRMTTISYGEERPLDKGHDEEAWAKNRRAQFEINP